MPQNSTEDIALSLRLSWAQKRAVLALYERGCERAVYIYTRIHPLTLEALERKGLIRPQGVVDGYQLTDQGRACARDLRKRLARPGEEDE